LREYAAEHTSTLLGRLVFEIHRSIRSRDADAIHDLRVAIRRFSQCLRVFDSTLPQREARKIRKRLRELIHSAAEVRDCDIAAELLSRYGGAARPAVGGQIERRRKEAELRLVSLLTTLDRSGFSSRWRAALELQGLGRIQVLRTGARAGAAAQNHFGQPAAAGRWGLP
jgi:CHAD domain-containing protein